MHIHSHDRSVVHSDFKHYTIVSDAAWWMEQKYALHKVLIIYTDEDDVYHSMFVVWR
jgi:hypothetical protein